MRMGAMLREAERLVKPAGWCGKPFRNVAEG
jgi:hypothetical protein